MKIKNLFSILSLLLIFSCAKETDEAPLDFENFKAEIQNDPIYQDYVSAQSTFLGHLAKKEIDLFAIVNTLSEQGVESYCSFDQRLIEGFRGAQKFRNSNCAVSENLTKLMKSNPTFLTLSAEQLYTILYVPIPVSKAFNNSNQASSRANCLAAFNQAYTESSAGCFSFHTDSDGNIGDWESEFCQVLGAQGGANAYDSCCGQSGASNCP